MFGSFFGDDEDEVVADVPLPVEATMLALSVINFAAVDHSAVALSRLPEQFKPSSALVESGGLQLDV